MKWTLELFKLHDSEKSSQRCTTHTADCNRAHLSTHIHTHMQHYSALCPFSPELSQHYWSWCCVSEVIAGSMAAGIGFSPQMLTGHFGTSLLLCEVHHIGERGVLLAPVKPQHNGGKCGGSVWWCMNTIRAAGSIMCESAQGTAILGSHW